MEDKDNIPLYYVVSFFFFLYWKWQFDFVLDLVRIDLKYYQSYVILELQVHQSTNKELLNEF